ncbi:hypothetical protein PM082_023872 [Marasmius tenuissimus]|nr:hypothetical protein PM082_023872 [Marasmius tenuissimus]
MRATILFLLSIATALNARSPGYQPVARVARPQSIQARATFVLEDDYQGEAFFNDFDFFTEPDPTSGLVNYQNKENAISKGLAFVENGVTVLAVDNTNTVPTGSNRDSVRIESKKMYGKGLFIADFEAMPFGCSIWPAWWSYSFTDYPEGGEIDVIEGVNNQPYNDMTFWRAGGQCNFPASALAGTADIVNQTACASTTTEQESCGFQDERSGVFGSEFSRSGGGVYAHLVSDEGISIWYFPRNAIPGDITSKNPDPSAWGTPAAQWKSDSCNISQHVRNHKLVINTTLCGSWAGSPNVWESSGCPGTCEATVANPKNFDNAQWKIRSVSVYQQQ